jgi:hypothetical protein
MEQVPADFVYVRGIISSGLGEFFNPVQKDPVTMRCGTHFLMLHTISIALNFRSF